MLMVDALPQDAKPAAMDVTFAALQSLRKQLKRSAAQCEALKAEVAELKRRDRTADLYKKKVRRKPFGCHRCVLQPYWLQFAATAFTVRSQLMPNDYHSLPANQHCLSANVSVLQNTEMRIERSTENGKLP